MTNGSGHKPVKTEAPKSGKPVEKPKPAENADK